MSNIYFTHLTSDKTDLDMKRDAFESDQAIWYDLLASQSNQLNSTIRNGATAWNKKLNIHGNVWRWERTFHTCEKFFLKK